MKYPQCAKCKIRYCQEESFCMEELPKFCPMKYLDCEELIEKSRSESKNERNKGKFINTILTEKEAYEMVRGKKIPVRPRIKELIELAKNGEQKKLELLSVSG